MWHSKRIQTVLKDLNTSPQGLREKEAEKRLEEFGLNKLEKEKPVSPFTLFLNQFKDILIIILLIAVGLSIVLGESVDALIIGIIVVFSALLGFIQEFRAKRALESLKKMLAETIRLIRDGEEKEINSENVVPGDVIVLEAGDRVPADGRLLEVASLKCDESHLSGESLPVEKNRDVLPQDTSVADRSNMVFTGSVVTYGRGKAVVTGTGMNTEFGRIAREVATVKKEKTPLEKRTEEIGKLLGLVAVVICVAVIGVSIVREVVQGTWRVESALTMLMFGVALAVAAVPEALAAIVTGTLAIGMKEMAKRNALIRKMPAVETLGCTTVICTDKTGTLTKGEMTVRKIYTGGKHIEVTGVGYEPKGKFLNASSIEKEDNPLHLLLKGAILCNDADLWESEGKYRIKGDPTEAALVVAAVKAGFNQNKLRKDYPRVSEVPFSSERKRMSTVHSSKKGNLVFIKGAPEVILTRITHIQEQEGVRPVKEKDRTEISKLNEEMALQGLRVLALGYRKIKNVPEKDEHTLEENITFLGLTGMMDPPRPEAVEAVQVCKRIKMKPVMITGDHKLTALSIAKEMGIYEDGDVVLTGKELEKMSEQELGEIVDKVSLYARVSPLDKLKIVNAWKMKGEVVAMTGDGVNDAPSLKRADIGIAMGITGTEVTKEAADMVLTDDNFATILNAIQRGRWIYDNIKKYLTYLLRCNIIEVLVIGGTVLAMGPQYLPLLPAAILYINLATDGLPALALGVSPPEPDIMERPPRSPQESVFSKEVTTFIILAVIFELPFFLSVFFISQPHMEIARTRMFFMFILIELAISLNFRSLKYSVFRAPPHKWLGLAVVWELILITILIQISSIRKAFGIFVPSIDDLGLIVGFCVLIFIALEGVKSILRHRRKGK